MGSTPEKATAIGTSIVDSEIGKAGDVDTAVVTLRYADGRIAVIKNSRRAVYGYDQRIELLGSAGLLSAGNVLENTVSKATTAGVVSAKPEHFFLERYMRSYSAEWAAFVEALTKGRAVPVTLDDGVNALAIAEAATRSAKGESTVDMASVGG
jgi:myo-inositol 2-dehydrogenase/D-chiro-inositol 1-dehydrogenase